MRFVSSLILALAAGQIFAQTTFAQDSLSALLKEKARSVNSAIVYDALGGRMEANQLVHADGSRQSIIARYDAEGKVVEISRMIVSKDEDRFIAVTRKFDERTKKWTEHRWNSPIGDNLCASANR